MSMYGDDSNGREKNDLYDNIKYFLKEHPVSELLKIVADVLIREKDN